MGHYLRGEIWIPLEDWYEFIGKYAPQSDGEVSYGPPTQNEEDIVIPYACNTACHPHEEVEPPAWAPKKRSPV